MGRRRSLRRGKRRLTLGRVLLILIVATGVGLGYFVWYSAYGPPPQGFPFKCLGSEGQPLHIHPKLQITVEGQGVTIPADIGILTNCFEPMHTHDTSGTIHVESATKSTQSTLGQFFQIWNATYHAVDFGGTSHPIVFNSTDILGFKTDSSYKVVMLVNGSPSSMDDSLALNSLDQSTIAIEYVASG